jgi:hypothetical protein
MAHMKKMKGRNVPKFTRQEILVLPVAARRRFL